MSPRLPQQPPVLLRSPRSQTAPHQLLMKSVELEHHYKSPESDFRQRLLKYFIQGLQHHLQCIQESFRGKLSSSFEQIHQAKRQLAHVVDTCNTLAWTRDELRIARYVLALERFLNGKVYRLLPEEFCQQIEERKTVLSM